jgi:hypothetical protein
MKLFYTLDAQKNPIVSAALDPRAGAPGAPVVGQAYFDTSTNRLLSWTGAAWVNLATDSALLNGQNGALYLSRASHTGQQAAATISDFSAAVIAHRLDQLTAPTAAVSLNGQKITNLADPTGAQDAATMGFVQSQVNNAAAGLDGKPSVRIVLTANDTLNGLAARDGVAIVAGDRILAVGQAAATANGVYFAAAGVWTRAADADQNGEITPGASWYVEEGSAGNIRTTWRVENTGAINIGVTALAINKVFGAINYTASLGVTLAGNDIRAQVVASGGIQAVAGGLQIDTAVVARKFPFTIGNGALTTIPIVHNLGTQDVAVQMRLAATNEAILVDWVATDANTVNVTFAVAPAAGAIKGVVIG